MAGKRPDQYRITPREAGATDYKTNPENNRGDDAEGDIRGDKQRLAKSGEAGEDQPFLPDVPAPSAEANRAAKRRQGQLDESEN